MAARRSRSSSGSNTRWVLPSDQRRLSSSATWPAVRDQLEAVSRERRTQCVFAGALPPARTGSATAHRSSVPSASLDSPDWKCPEWLETVAGSGAVAESGAALNTILIP